MSKSTSNTHQSEQVALENKFLACVKEAQNSQANADKPISNDTKLKLYAFYKQATQGDASGPKPAFLDLVGRAKYKAWDSLKGMESYEAMQKYIEVFESVRQ